METKKSNKSNLEKYRSMFLQIGVIFALSLSLMALKWKTDKGFDLPEGINISEYDGDVEIIPITRTPPEVKQPPILPVIHKLVIQDDFSDIIEGEIDFSVDIDPGDFTNMIPFDDEPEKYDDTPFIHAENMPEFMGGGLDTFRKFVMSKLEYPQMARDMNIQGTVYIYFVINKEGVLTDLRIMRGVDPLLDNEVLSVVKDTPKWEPGKQRGNPVNVMFNMPVSFKLN